MHSPTGHRIDSIHSFSRGIICGGAKGYIWSYEVKMNDRSPFHLIQERLGFDEVDRDINTLLPEDNVMSLALAPTEDLLYFINSKNQLMKVNVALDGTDGEQTKFEFVHSQFHSQHITGMDVCLRKQLIVTTSHTQINIWNYATKTLEIPFHCKSGDEASAVAFHPSGFHIVVAFADKIQLMNVLSSSIKEFANVPIKGCREISFSPGGHLFACGVQQSSIHVYNFYTLECPSYRQLRGHLNRVRSIDWFDDDTGFNSCAQDGTAYCFDLEEYKETGARKQDIELNKKGVQFTGLAKIPGKQYETLVVGSDKNIWHSAENKKAVEVGVQLSQVQILSSGKACFAGVGEEGRPGAV